jgi:hypothetical protein
MENVLFTRQRHEADKAGLHWDYRIVVGGKALSWATKKELPDMGKSIMLWEQPVHTAHYALSEKVVIPKGQYGSGTTTLDWIKKGKAQFDDGKIVIHANEGRFLLKKMPNYEDGTGWLFKQLPKEEKENMEKKSENKYLEKIAGPYSKYIRSLITTKSTDTAVSKALTPKLTDGVKELNFGGKRKLLETMKGKSALFKALGMKL